LSSVATFSTTIEFSSASNSSATGSADTEEEDEEDEEKEDEDECALVSTLDSTHTGHIHSSGTDSSRVRPTQRP
jgi:hypothetical protein